jgi:hypothetical protein
LVSPGEQRFLNALKDLQGRVHEAVETCQVDEVQKTSHGETCGAKTKFRI